jgi:DNA-directed RNA polymerase specialized sigma24 family protein
VRARRSPDADTDQVVPLVPPTRAAPEAVVVRPHGSFDDFYRREYDALLILSLSLIGIRASAEDVVQDAFLAVALDWDRVQNMSNPGTWTRRIVINKSASWHRRRAVEGRALRFWMSQGTGIAKTPAPGDFWEVVRQLPRRQAASVALYYLEDRSMPEIAEILGCAEATVRVHLFKARRTLGTHFREDGGPDGS